MGTMELILKLYDYFQESPIKSDALRNAQLASFSQNQVRNNPLLVGVHASSLAHKLQSLSYASFYCALAAGDSH